MALQTDTFVAPSWLASALINGDTSGLEFSESAKDDLRALRWLLAWVRWFYGPSAQIVDCGEEGFRRDCWPMIRGPRCLDIPSMRLAGNAAVYTVLYREGVEA